MTDLTMVTLTINNDCNLACPHCYLQGGKAGVLTADVAEAVLEAVALPTVTDFVFVGKEPFLNPDAIRILHDLMERSERQGLKLAVVTNGLGLGLVPTAMLEKFHHVDISLDGGPETYGLYRKGSFDKIHRNVREARERSSGFRLRVLHTISQETVRSIADMAEGSRQLGAELSLYQPFLQFRLAKGGTFDVKTLGLIDLLHELCAVEGFWNDPTAYLYVDRLNLNEDGITLEFFAREVTKLGYAHKVFYIDRYPLARGIVRVTYDGFVLDPVDAAHRLDETKGIHLAQVGYNIRTAFDMLCAR